MPERGKGWELGSLVHLQTASSSFPSPPSPAQSNQFVTTSSSQWTPVRGFGWLIGWFCIHAYLLPFLIIRIMKSSSPFEHMPFNDLVSYAFKTFLHVISFDPTNDTDWWVCWVRPHFPGRRGSKWGLCAIVPVLLHTLLFRAHSPQHGVVLCLWVDSQVNKAFD